MGLKVYIDAPNNNEAYIVIDINSVLKLIENKITFPNKRVYLEKNYMIVKIWRDSYGV